MRKQVCAAMLMAAAGLACTAQAQDVMISEIMYNPASTETAAPTFDNQVEWLEIYNYGTTSVNIGNWVFRDEDGIAGTIPANTTLAAGAVAILIPGTQTDTEFRAAWSTMSSNDAIFLMPTWNIAAPNGLSGLSNSPDPALPSERLVLLDAAANEVDVVSYDDANGWPTAADGSGASLYVNSISLNKTANDFPGAWLAASAGTDGAVDVIQGGDFDGADKGSPGVVVRSTDCNNNSIADDVEINNNGGVGGIGGTLDCDSNGAIDLCQINGSGGTGGVGGGLDCNSNGILDTCDIAANPGLDCDTDNRIDTCEIAQFPDLDTCNGGPNGILDQCDTPVEDCNFNGVDDCWEYKIYALTDVNSNGVADVCEGAIVTEAFRNVQVRDSGPFENAPFLNVEGAGNGTFANYGLLRWTHSPNGGIATGGGAQIREIYLQLVQSNATFTVGGFSGLPDNVEILHTNLDDIEYLGGGSTLTFSNFATDWTDAVSVDSYLFVQGSNPPPLLPGTGSTTGSGEIEKYKLYDETAPTPGGDAVAFDIIDASSEFTLLMRGIPDAGLGDYVAATYAGRTNFAFGGPTLVIFARCDGLDFNRDGVYPDNQDLIDLISVFGAGACSTGTCNDLDFNNDGVFPDSSDLVLFISAFGAGVCP